MITGVLRFRFTFILISKLISKMPRIPLLLIPAGRYDMFESGDIESGTHVEYIFRSSIALNPGFEVEPGAKFRADAGPNL